MAKQNKDIQRDDYQNRVLDLEKKYFQIILNVIRGKDFNDDLLLIEKDIRDNYRNYENVWNLKNKLKIPAERIVCHHIYMKLKDIITGVYPSPVSSDIGIKTNDAVICVDVKTIDIQGNAVDTKSTSVEKNQISFDNSNYVVVPTTVNLKPIDHYSDKPVLTYVVKIIYSDDKYTFSLARNEFPTLVLCSIPNGKLSNLFDKNIVMNFKTYEYFTEKDGADYVPITLDDKQKDDQDVIDEIMKAKGYMKYPHPSSKPVYFDPKTKTSWWKVSSSKKTSMEAIKSGSTMRISNEVLRDRFDSKSQSWQGYIEFDAPKPI